MASPIDFSLRHDQGTLLNVLIEESMSESDAAAAAAQKVPLLSSVQDSSLARHSTRIMTLVAEASKVRSRILVGQGWNDLLCCCRIANASPGQRPMRPPLRSLRLLLR